MSLDDVEASSYQSRPRQLFRFVMGSVVWGLVSGESQPFRWNNVDFMPDAVVELGQIDQSLAESTPSVEIPVESTAGVAQQFIAYLPAEPIFLYVYRLNEAAGDGEYGVEFIGEVVTSAFDESTGVCTLTARMVSAAMSRNVPWCVYSTNCQRALYGVGCDVNREDYVTVTNIVGGAGTTAISSADFASAAADHGATDPVATTEWFRNGFVRHVESNEVRTVIGHDGTTLYLHTPFSSLKNGDQVRAYAGCDRTRGHCLKKFKNLDKMLAFPWQPLKNPYTQNVYGTGSAGSGVWTQERLDNIAGSLVGKK